MNLCCHHLHPCSSCVKRPSFFSVLCSSICARTHASKVLLFRHHFNSSMPEKIAFNEYMLLHCTPLRTTTGHGTQFQMRLKVPSKLLAYICCQDATFPVLVSSPKLATQAIIQDGFFCLYRVCPKKVCSVFFALEINYKPPNA